MATKHCKDKREIYLLNNEKRNYESDTRDDTDPDQANKKYPL